MCMRIVFNFSWDHCNTQEKLKTKVMQTLAGAGGGGSVIHEKCANGE